MHPLTTIACGDAPRKGAIGEVLAHLASNLDRLLVRAVGLIRAGDPTDLALFGPLLGRATMEVALTAITARFDPHRVLAIRRSQLANTFDVKERNPMAFTWAGDVKGDEKPKDWDQKPGIKDVQRALLCKHFQDLFWHEAFTLLMDAVPFHRGGGWMTRLKRIYPEGFVTAMRSDADRVYAELSKGIHQEFVIPAATQYDPTTVTDLLGRSWELAATLAITTCFSPAVTPLRNADPVACYEETQEELYR
jgi:hypothetical protein